MKKSNNNTWKRIAAGALSLALVAGALPANVGGLLTGGKGIVASAAETKQIALNETYSVGDTITNNSDVPVYFRASHVPGDADNYIRISKGGSLTVRTIRYSADDYYGYKWMMEFQGYTDAIDNVDARIATNMAVTYEGESYYTVNSLKVVSGSGTQSDPYVFGLGDYNTNLRVINDEHIQISNDFDYTGSAQEPVLKWVNGNTETTLVKGTDYTIEEIKSIKDNANEPVNSAKDAGLYRFAIKGKGQYAGSDVVRQVGLRINPVALTNDNLAAGGEVVNGVLSQLTYTGEEQAVKLYYKNGNNYVPLTAGTDYDLTSFEGHIVGYPGSTRLTTSKATNVGNYSASIVAKGNYKMQENYSNIYAFWSIAKANLTATDYTAPTGSDDLKYKAAEIPLLKDGNTGSVAVDTNTSEPVGTMNYAATRYRAVSANELRISSIDDVAVDDIYKPTSNDGIYFPVGYTIKVGNSTYDYSKDYSGVNFFVSPSNKKCYFGGTNEPVDYNALKITDIDKENKFITAEFVDYNTAYNALVNNLEWNTDVPKGTDLGNWYVWYKVVGDANHNDTKPAYVTSKIDYKKSTLTLADSLGTFKVTEVANGTETEVTADNGVYTLSATKTYKIYTQNTVSTDEKSKYRLSEAYHDKENDDDVFEYEYTLKLAVDPAFSAYILSHLSNWTGNVYTDDPTKLYIADGEVTPNTRKLAATLKANSTYYYGDVIDASSIEIDEAYKELIKVKNVYFSDSTGAAVDINNAKYGTYSLRAEIVVDNNANGAFDDNGVDLTYTVYKDVEYKARPMAENDYYVKTPDGELKLTVANGTVTVPEKYYVYSGISDFLGGSGSDNKYVVTEKSEAHSTIFSRCEEKQTFTYNGTEQKPTIIVKNGGNNADVVASIPATDTADAAAKDYIDGVKAETNAGDYSYTLTAETGTTEAPANYSGAVTVKWTIAKADINGYISVAPKNNVDTDEVKGNDAIVYDGAVLDGTDFEVTKSEAYDNGGPIVKALVDEFIAQLTATPATETTPAVAAKTTVDVAPAIGKVYSDNIKYETTDANGITLSNSDESLDAYAGKVIGGNIVVTPSSITTDGENITSHKLSIRIDNDDENIQEIVNGSKFDTSSFTLSNISFSSDYTLAYDSENDTLTIKSWIGTEYTYSAKEGYKLYIERIEGGINAAGSLDSSHPEIGETIYIVIKAVPTSGFADGKSNIKDASVKGEVKKANVTVKNSNFKDVEFKQTLTNDGKIDTTVEDKSIPVTIAKRDVTLTPDEDLSMTYRDTEMPDLTYTIEDAKADGLTGVVAADKALFQKTTGEGNDAETINAGAIYVDALVQAEANAQAVAFKYAKTGEGNDVATDYTTALLNNAGSYTYAAFDFDNYVVVFPEDDAPTFTVDPLDLNVIKNLSIVLNGKTNDWTQDDNSGYYTYDGTTKQVEVKKVAKAAENTALSTVFIDSDWVQTESRNFAVEKEDVKLAYNSMDSSTGIISVYNDGVNDMNAILTANSGKVIKSVSFGIKDFGRRDNALLTEGTTAADIVSNEGGVFDPDTHKLIFNDIESDTFTLSAMNGYKLTISSVEITYGDDDVFVLSRDTDYTVGGMTKSATVGEKTVQVKGKGNYTGVAKATWKMKPVEDVESLVTFKINDDAEWIDLPQDVQFYDWHYTGEPISCGAEFTDSDSNYAQDAEVTVKYTHLNNITGEYEEVDEAVHQGKYKVNVKVECDGYSPVEFNYDIIISPKEIRLENTPFTINYGEDYSDHTDELLALFVKNGLLQSDADLIKQMLEDGTLIWYYYYDEYNGEGRLYPTWSEDVLEAAAEEAVKEDKDTNWTVIESMIHKLYGDAVYQVANAHDNDIILVNPIIKPKSIKSDDVTVEFTNGNTVVLDENGFVEESSIIVKDTGILNDDGEPTVLLADTDYELNIESTATEGEYIVEVVGKGNYRAIRKVTFTAVTIKPTAETTVEDAANSKLRLTVNAGTEDSSLVAKTGVIFYRGTNCPAELTIESAAANNDIYDFSAEGTAFTGTVKDSKGGVHYVGYIVLTNGTVKYTDVISTTINDEILNANKPTANTTIEDAANSKLRLMVNAETEDSSLVTKTGVIFYRGTNCPEELTIESAAANNDIYDFSLEGTSFTGTVKDSKGGVHYVGYTVLVNGTVKYTDSISTKISDFVN